MNDTIEIPPIETERLKLCSISTAFLRELAKPNMESARNLVEYTIPKNCSISGHSQISRRLEMIETNPLQRPWMYRAIVRKGDNTMVGFISFHHMAPDPDIAEYTKMGTELGYTIEKEFRRMGYAKEAAIGMMEWAHQNHNVSDFILTICPSNEPSLRLAESMNFRIVGKHDDPIDGLEHVTQASIDQVVRTKKTYRTG